MHELSIASSLMDLCLETALKNNAVSIKRIKIKVGKMSGVMPHFLQSAFEAVQKNTIAENAVLEIVEEEIEIQCKGCGQKTKMETYAFICPACGSPELEILSGNDLQLLDMDIE